MPVPFAARCRRFFLRPSPLVFVGQFLFAVEDKFVVPLAAAIVELGPSALDMIVNRRLAAPRPRTSPPRGVGHVRQLDAWSRLRGSKRTGKILSPWHGGVRLVELVLRLA
ncbi:hypothetical protein FB451DRAFT_1416782 [Mycena latifolia]|nr:hypothetical protein FB451DRAFT_1416782 [Mycena latifolia]